MCSEALHLGGDVRGRPVRNTLAMSGIWSRLVFVVHPFRIAICHYSLVTRKGKLTGSTSHPAACRVDI